MLVNEGNGNILKARLNHINTFNVTRCNCFVNLPFTYVRMYLDKGVTKIISKKNRLKGNSVQ